MQRHLVTAVAAIAILVAACGGSATPSPSAAPSAAAPSAASASAAASSAASPSAAGFDVSAISGPVVLSGWQSSPSEGNALTQTLLGFQSTYPNVKVDYQPVAGDYPTVMATKFASKDVPDLFYVNADYAQQWIDQGFLAPLDDYIAKSSFDTFRER